jgi:hypothetical protein
MDKLSNAGRAFVIPDKEKSIGGFSSSMRTFSRYGGDRGGGQNDILLGLGSEKSRGRDANEAMEMMVL